MLQEGDLVPSLFLSFSFSASCLPSSWPLWSTIRFLTWCSASPCTGPEAMKSSDCGLKPLQLWAQQTLPPLSCFPQVFCHSDGMLSNILVFRNVIRNLKQHDKFQVCMGTRELSWFGVVPQSLPSPLLTWTTTQPREVGEVRFSEWAQALACKNLSMWLHCSCFPCVWSWTGFQNKGDLNASLPYCSEMCRVSHSIFYLCCVYPHVCTYACVWIMFTYCCTEYTH
jgi:hypothetical protein